MICLRCDCETFSPDVRDVTQEFKGQTLVVNTAVMVCTKCGWFTVGNNQVNQLVQRTKAAFENHNRGVPPPLVETAEASSVQ